jgi:hypothetical protein
MERHCAIVPKLEQLKMIEYGFTNLQRSRCLIESGIGNLVAPILDSGATRWILSPMLVHTYLSM